MPRPSAKGRILDAALETIHGQGYNATSIQDITAAAGAPKGSFYNHFASKEALCLEILDLYRERELGILGILEVPGTPSRDRLIRHFAALTEGNKCGLERGCLIGNLAAEAASASPAVRDRLARMLSEWTSLLAACIREGQASGELAANGSPEDLAAFLVNAYEGAILRAKADCCEEPFRQFEHFLLVLLD
ncbi:MAG: TetR family transcriptional regulator C-terminal domain-containing protein [Bryobacterales bacterium]|nr:TetR family transcriptional regulator C-terminal domain-containing protein [Bryobacterales bacterium]